MARILSLSTDLLLGSKVEATLSAAGHEVVPSPSVQEADLNGIELAVADLDLGSAEALVGLGFPVLGYYSHVDVATREAAEAAGVDLVVPRSRMARELPALAERLLGGDGGGGD
jgi:hypothetical protein